MFIGEKKNYSKNKTHLRKNSHKSYLHSVFNLEKKMEKVVFYLSTFFVACTVETRGIILIIITVFNPACISYGRGNTEFIV